MARLANTPYGLLTHFDFVYVLPCWASHPKPRQKKEYILSEKMKQIKVFFPVDDYEILKQTSKSQEITMSEFIRKSVNSKVKNPPSPKLEKKVYRTTDPKLLYELNKIGTNLNQIAREVNKKKDDYPSKRIYEEIYNIHKLLKEIM